MGGKEGSQRQGGWFETSSAKISLIRIHILQVVTHLEVPQFPRSESIHLAVVLPWCSLDSNVRRHILGMRLVVTHVCTVMHGHHN